MVRHSGDSGFSGARPGYLRTAALALVLVLAGCASAPSPDIGPWGYEFALGKYKDQRADDDTKLMAEVPFNVETFMQDWRTHAKRDIFSNHPALLDVTLTKYEATQSGWSYALSMEMHLQGHDTDGRLLADKTVSCDVVEPHGNRVWGESLQQVVTKGDLSALTVQHRTGTMWQEVWDSCVKDIEVQFGEALRAGVSSGS